MNPNRLGKYDPFMFFYSQNGKVSFESSVTGTLIKGKLPKKKHKYLYNDGEVVHAQFDQVTGEYKEGGAISC